MSEGLISLDEEPVVQQILATSAPCAVHKRHDPRSHVNEKHHIWPLGEGGPSTAGNLVVVCSSGHNNIHLLIKLLAAHKGNVPPVLWRTFTAGEKKYALIGYDRITRKAM